jgi:predicted transcriptional regulator
LAKKVSLLPNFAKQIFFDIVIKVQFVMIVGHYILTNQLILF